MEVDEKEVATKVEVEVAPASKWKRVRGEEGNANKWGPD